MDSRFESQFAIEAHENQLAKLEAIHRFQLRRWTVLITSNASRDDLASFRNWIHEVEYLIAEWPHIPFPYPGWW